MFEHDSRVSNSTFHKGIQGSWKDSFTTRNARTQVGQVDDRLEMQSRKALEMFFSRAVLIMTDERKWRKNNTNPVASSDLQIQNYTSSKARCKSASALHWYRPKTRQNHKTKNHKACQTNMAMARIITPCQPMSASRLITITIIAIMIIIISSSIFVVCTVLIYIIILACHYLFSLFTSQLSTCPTTVPTTVIPMFI